MTQNNIRTIAIISVMVMMAASLAAVISLSDVDADEQTYDEDLGKKYSMTVQLVFTGSDAESIKYDFGDGTTSSEFSPKHTYAAEGVYYITQTVYNSYNGGSESTAVYRVEIMGYPEIFFEENGGSAVADIQQTAWNVVAVQPDDPVRAGYAFAGWYTDADCTEIFDWSQGVTKDITLYAGWTADGSGTEPGTPEEPEHPEPAEGFELKAWMVILVVIVIVAIIGIARWRL